MSKNKKNQKTEKIGDLPIKNYKEEILEAVAGSPVTVITAETGAGKSTQVPQYLLEAGYDLVVTQPRRLAARTVAARVAEEMKVSLGQLIGWRTGGGKGEFSPATRCLFCTDGLALVRELMGQNQGVLVLDEVHEWNENMEVLVAWARSQIQAGTDFKVVLMSATMEAEKLSAFFDNAPVISVPGRMFPVEERSPAARLVSDVATLLGQGRNVLVFQPGKQEISETISALKQIDGLNAEILPLHGGLEPSEQKKCFARYGRPKCVVSTNVAQTSVTIPDIDAVVDSGLERRIELVDGVEGLYLRPISLADSTQRKGRAGRCKQGVYIDHCRASRRPDFPVAEILRKRLDQTVLRLAIAGFDMEELEFFHQPSKSDIHDARQTLIKLGCLEQSGQVTRIGKLVNRLPVSVQNARMLVEADQRGVVDDVLTVAAIMEEGGITVPPPSRNKPDRPDWRRMVPTESESDVMGQLSVWEQARSMTKDQMRQSGISLRSYHRAKEIRRNLADALKRFFRFGSTGKREDILKSVCAGMVDHLYEGSYGTYRNGDNTERELGIASVVRSAKWVVGIPFDLEIKARRGMMTLRLISMASKVDPSWLVEVAPQLVSKQTGLSPRYDAEKDCVVSTTQTFFNQQKVRAEEVEDPMNENASRIFAYWLASRSGVTGREAMNTVLLANSQRQEQARKLNIRTGEETFHVYSQSEVTELYQSALDGASRLAEIRDPSQLALPPLCEARVEQVMTENPDTVTIEGVELTIEYGKEYYGSIYCRTSVEEGFARTCQVESVVLPSGRTVEIRCSGHSAKTFVELVEKLEKSRIDRCWSEARSQHETSYTSDTQKVVGWLSKVGSSIEITRMENGVPIYGYVGLKRYSGYSEWQLFLADTEEKAAEETQKSLEVLLKAAVKEQLAIPQEKPWQAKGSGWYSSWSLTDLGNALQSRYETLVREHAKDLSSSNIEAKIEALKAACEKAKLEIGGEHSEVKQLIETTEKQVETLIEGVDDSYFVESEVEQVREAIRNAKDYLKSAAYGDTKASCEIAAETASKLSELCTSRSQTKREAEDARSEVSDELYNLQYGYDEYVDATAEERSEADEVSRDISNALSDRRYEVVIKKVADAQKLIDRVKAAMPDRQAARRVRFPEAVWEAVGDDEYTAERAVELAKAAADIVGAKQALHIFDRELNAPYGRASRQDGIYHSMSEIAQTDIGSSFLRLYRARDVDAWLAGAVAWLEEEESKKPTPPRGSSFSHTEGRHFACSCGHGMARLTKGKYKRWSRGETVELACPTCGFSGSVQQDVEPTQPKENKPSPSEGEIDLSKLQRWANRGNS